MDIGQHINFTGDLSNRTAISTIDAWLTRENTLTDNPLLECLEFVLDVIGAWTVFYGQLLDNSILDLAHALIACSFFGDSISVTQISHRSRFYRLAQRRIYLGCRPIPTWLTCIRHELVDRLDDRLHFLVRKQHSAQHLVF